MNATLDDLGRVLIPKQMRDELGLNPGAVLKIEEKENQIVLTPVLDEEALVVEDGVLIFTGALEGDPDLVIQQDREERARKVAGLD
jgi:AbrB family looped-hinge helix DNA binding protein